MKQEVVTVGLDLAKSVFQVHAIGRDGTVLVRRKLRRAASRTQTGEDRDGSARQQDSAHRLGSDVAQ